MAFWIKIFFGVCRIVIGGRFSGAGHERGGSSCSLCSIFCETENLQSSDFPFITPRTHRRCCSGTLQPIWLGLPARCAAAVAWKQRIKIEISAASTRVFLHQIYAAQSLRSAAVEFHNTYINTVMDKLRYKLKKCY